METLQMAGLEGFGVGGTVHLTVNNQLGFTTPSIRGRTSSHSTDLARLIEAPVFHVNADAPEAVGRAAALALAFREQWGKDVFIDLIGYRRHGHNELDEPAFTQPAMYKVIRGHRSGASLYAPTVMSLEKMAEVKESAYRKLDEALATSYKPVPSGIQEPIENTSLCTPTAEELIGMAAESVNVPSGFKVHTRLAKFHVETRKSLTKDSLVDWATAETMAVGSLLTRGVSVRLSGQDVGRGTFSHRHWQLTCQETGRVACPLERVAQEGGAKLEVVNSHLSEAAVSGFELGLSWQKPSKLLPMWEAQFGDFFNGAQIVWDAYLSGGHQKWGLRSALTLLLPHGYDGAGPEHSSCRLERWLQLCDEPIHSCAVGDVNMGVVHPTTPANYFHLLRRQATMSRPLIVASPKTLLRLPAAQSPLSELITGQFQPVLAETISDEVETIVLCSGTDTTPHHDI